MDDIADGDIDGGLAGRPLAAQLNLPGGAAASTWSVVSGRLPAGLVLSAGGVLSGTPAEDGDFPVIVRARISSPLPQLRVAAVEGVATDSACQELAATPTDVECHVTVVVYPAVTNSGQAVELTSATSQAIDTWDDATGDLGLAPGTDLGGMEVGKVINIPVDNPTVPLGGLRKITGISPRADGGTNVSTEQGQVSEYIRDGAVRQEATDMVDATGKKVASPSVKCGRNRVEEISLTKVDLPGFSIELSGSACVVQGQRFESDDGNTTSYTTVSGLKDITLEGEISGLSADYDQRLLDLVTFDDLMTGVPGMPIRPNVDVGLFLAIKVANPFSLGFTLTQDRLYEQTCDGTTCSEPELIVDESEFTTTPADPGSFTDGDVAEYSVALSAGIDLGVEVIDPGRLVGGKPDVRAKFLTVSWRAGAAVRGAANPDPLSSDDYPFDWALYGESSIKAELASLNLDSYFGRFEFAGPTYEKSFQLPLLRSDGLSFTNFPDSADYPLVAVSGSGLPDVAVNVVQVDGQITPETGKLLHPSTLAGIPVTLELRTASIDDDGDVEVGSAVAEALTSGTEVTTGADGQAPFNDVQLDSEVPAGNYVLHARAADPDGRVFPFDEPILEGSSPIISVEQVEWLPTAVPHPDRVQLGWPEYQLDETDDGDLAGYRIYRLDRDDNEPSLPADGTMPYDVVATDVIEEPYCSATSNPPADAYGGCVTWTDPDPDAINQRYTYAVAPCFSRTLVPGFLTCASNFGAGGSTLGFYEGQPIDIPRAPEQLRLSSGYSESAVLDTEPQDYDGRSSFAWVDLPNLVGDAQRVRLYSCSERLASEWVSTGPNGGAQIARAFGGGFLPYPASYRATWVENTQACTPQQQPHHNPGWFTVRVQSVGAIRSYPGPFPTDRRPGAPIGVQFNFTWGRIAPRSTWDSAVYTGNLSPWPGQGPTGLTRYAGPGPVDFPDGCLPTSAFSAGPCVGQSNDGQVAELLADDPALADLAVQCDHSAWLTVVNDRGQESPLSRPSSATGVETFRRLDSNGQLLQYFGSCEPDVNGDQEPA